MLLSFLEMDLSSINKWKFWKSILKIFQITKHILISTITWVNTRWSFKWQFNLLKETSKYINAPLSYIIFVFRVFRTQVCLKISKNNAQRAPRADKKTKSLRSISLERETKPFWSLWYCSDPHWEKTWNSGDLSQEWPANQNHCKGA